MSSTERRPTWSIRQRLAGSLALVIVGVLALLFVVLDARISEGIASHLDEELVQRARSVEAVLLAHGPSTLEQLMPGYRMPGHMEFFTVYDGDGQAWLMSSNSDGVALPRPDGAHTPHHFDVRTPDDHAARGFALPLETGPYRGSTLVLATEREDWDAFQQRIHRTLMVGIALATTIVVVLSLLLVRQAFAPIERERRRIATLDPQGNAPPLGVGLPSELAPLASAYDTGVGRLYTAIERERRFSRDIAHELRTPVAEVRTGAEVALDSGDAASLREGLRTAVAATDRMQRSIDTLLALARFESGQEAPALDPLDLAALLAQHVHWLAPRAAAQGRDLHLSASAPAWIHSDAGMLERIASNLIDNAIEYAPAGSRIDCRVESLRDDAGREHHALCITNEAPDLVATDLELIGSRFWRKGEAGGTSRHAGLGLALSGGFAQALGVSLAFALHDGRLEVRVGRFAAL